MKKKSAYKQENLEYLAEIAVSDNVQPLPCGIYYKVIESGAGVITPTPRSIVTTHYKGGLISGKVFDSSYERNCPEAFRLCDVIEGWQLALQRMHVGDKWIIYIPYSMGYGEKSSGPILGFSTLIFEVELLGIA